MMYCMSCGAKLNDNVLVCPICKAPIAIAQEQAVSDSASAPVNQSVRQGAGQDMYQGQGVGKSQDNGRNPYVRRSHKKLSLRTKLCLALGIIFILAVCGLTYYLKSPARAVMLELQDDDYAQAYSIYRDDIDGEAVQEFILKPLLKHEITDMVQKYEEGSLNFNSLVGRLGVILGFDMEKINDIVYEQIIAAATSIKKDYEAEKCDFDSVCEELNALLSLCNDEKKADEVMTILMELQVLKASRDAYAEAEKQYAEGNYGTALDQYAQVNESDDNYAAAQEKIAECTNEYRGQILNQTEAPETDEEYENAISLLKIALDVLPEDGELLARQNSLIEEYAAKLKSEALEQGTQLIKEENYADAFALINKALKYNENDSELTSFLRSSQSAYESYIAEQVNDFTAVYDYASALDLLNTALSTLPDSTALAELLEQTEANQPVRLCDIKVAEAENYEQITELVVTEDSMGNRYNPENLFKASCSIWGSNTNRGGEVKGYAKYYLNGEYTKLMGTVVAADDSEITGCVLTIYGDSKIIYISDVITRATSPLEIDLDVTGITWIHMEFSIPEEADACAWMRVLLADMMLYKN